MKIRIQAAFLAAAISGMTAVASQAQATGHDGQDAHAPRAFGGFCVRHPQQCAVQGVAGSTVSMDGVRWSQLRSINLHVNRSIRSVDDRDNGFSGDVWSLAGPGEAGDCEDYALTKRSMLIARGWPSSSLLISVVRTSSGEGHAVLIARTSDGHYVLDNRTDSIRKVAHSGYRYYLMQSPDNPRRWVAVPRSGPVDDAGTMLIAGAGKPVVGKAPGSMGRAAPRAKPASLPGHSAFNPGAFFASSHARALRPAEMPIAGSLNKRRLHRN